MTRQEEACVRVLAEATYLVQIKQSNCSFMGIIE
jgi:hypothetical protein